MAVIILVNTEAIIKQKKVIKKKKWQRNNVVKQLFRSHYFLHSTRNEVPKGIYSKLNYDYLMITLDPYFFGKKLFV